MPGVLSGENMNDFIEKLIEEKNELEAKAAHLFVFIHVNPKYKELSGKYQTLLERQYFYMCNYADILEERIAIYEYEVGDKPIAVDCYNNLIE